MDKKYEALFTPWKIGKVEIKNRIVMCPMGGTSLFGWMGPQKFNKEAADMFLNIAKNGCGLIIPGIAPLRNMLGGGWLYKVSQKEYNKLSTWLEEFHKTGAKLFVQLTAGFGRSFSIPNHMTGIVKSKFLSKLVKPVFDFDRLLAAPSALPARWYPEHTVREITVEEIKGIVKGYALTAKRLKDAGVDGVEVHAVHEGYLIDQFTTKYTNKRTDEYGGSFENRYRFATDIVKAIKAECGEDFPVSVRYSALSKTKDFCVGALPGEDYEEVGRDMEESEKAVKYLQDAGYDMLNTDNGTYDAWYWAHPPVYMPENCNLEDVAHVGRFCDIPVVCAGKMDAEVAAKAIKEGRIDGMGVARQFLTDNEWITKLQEDRLEDIMPCIHCHNGCFPLAHYKGVASDTPLGDSIHMARCALNPQTMDGGKYDWMAHADKFPGLCTPDESYHGVTYAERFGKEGAYIYKATAQLMRDLGSTQSPQSAYLLNLGLESLHVRMERHCLNALKVAEYLETSDKITWVNYPGLQSNKYYELASKYMPNGTCGVVSFGVKGGREVYACT